MAAFIISHPPEDESEFKKAKDESHAKIVKEVKDPKVATKKVVEKEVPTEGIQTMSMLEKAKTVVSQIHKTASIADIESAIYNVMKVNSFSKEFFYFLGIQGVFDENLHTDLIKFVTLFKPRLEKDVVFGYIALLSSIQIFVCEKYPALKVMIATIMQSLYNSDLISEEFLVDWSKNKVKFIVSLYKQEYDDLFRKESEVFFKWLADADDANDEKEALPKPIIPKETIETVDVTKLEVKKDQINIDDL